MTPTPRGLGRAEIAKDTVEILTQTTAVHVARIASILGGAIQEVAREIGDLATDVFEMRDAAGRAVRDGEPDAQ
jgi:hypothetical protein